MGIVKKLAVYGLVGGMCFYSGVCFSQRHESNGKECHNKSILDYSVMDMMILSKEKTGDAIIDTLDRIVKEYRKNEKTGGG